MLSTSVKIPSGGPANADRASRSTRSTRSARFASNVTARSEGKVGTHRGLDGKKATWVQLRFLG